MAELALTEWEVGQKHQHRLVNAEATRELFMTEWRQEAIPETEFPFQTSAIWKTVASAPIYYYCSLKLKRMFITNQGKERRTDTYFVRILG